MKKNDNNENISCGGADTRTALTAAAARWQHWTPRQLGSIKRQIVRT